MQRGQSKRPRHYKTWQMAGSCKPRALVSFLRTFRCSQVSRIWMASTSVARLEDAGGGGGGLSYTKTGSSSGVSANVPRGSSSHVVGAPGLRGTELSRLVDGKCHNFTPNFPNFVLQMKAQFDVASMRGRSNQPSQSHLRINL